MLLNFLSKYKIDILLIIPIIAINSFGLLGVYFFLPRSIFYYEYLLVLLSIAFFKNYRISFLLFILIFIFDLFNIISKLFLFKIDDFIQSISFVKLYNFSLNQIFIFIFFVTYLIIIKLIVKKTKSTIDQNKKKYIIFIFILYFLIFLLDALNGSGRLFTQREHDINETHIKKNIISPLYKEYKVAYQDMANDTISTLKDTSVSFKSFLKDSSGNQLVILVESWGIIKDTLLQGELVKIISNSFYKKGFNVSSGNSKYYGSTTAAGLRELLNASGSYSYFINKSSNKTKYISILDVKTNQGYDTYMFHPYTGEMFSRSKWWKNLGAKNLFFRENYLIDNNFKAEEVDEDARFPSIKDDTFFDYLLQKTQKSKKKFVYYLTVNSHLPYTKIVSEHNPSSGFNIEKMPITNEAKFHLIHIKNLIEYFSQKIEANEWNKILIIGDHTPPFSTLTDRNFYVDGKVPYLLITKK